MLMTLRAAYNTPLPEVSPIGMFPNFVHGGHELAR